ncbi:MAG: hypothetical protein CALGDGBN_01198 [Pseudomonadales bacterium]|nr:hypothetical protein [Pseudomonadales bacterium]
MHFRIRKHVVQFVRTTYDAERKKPRAQVVGSMPATSQVVPAALLALITADERLEAEAWIAHGQRTLLLRDELAARSLAETLAAANRWFARQDRLSDTAWISGSILPELQTLRKQLARLLG